MRARYASFAASFLLVLAVGAALAYAVHSGSAPPTAASTSTATATPTATATATPVARAHFDVYRDGLTLTYVREPCTEADTAPRFFVRYYPVSSADLQGERGRMRGHNSAGFGFADRGTRSGGRCETTLAMPSAYAIERVLTGQYDGSGHTWEAGFPLDATAWRAHYDRIAMGAPRVRSTWDVYLDGRTLTWIRGSCSAADTARRFFVRYYPADTGNLNGSRGRSRGYNDTGFGFTDRGLRYEGKCMASFELPAYAVTRIVTGQYDSSGHTWEAGFPLDPAAWRARYDRIAAGAPRVRSTWDVYLGGRTLTWIRGSCAAADTARRFFVRYYPADAANLQGERGRTRGYNDTDFGFTDRGLRYEGKCMASFDLPEYPATRIVTGQYDADGHTWEGGFPLDPAAWRARYDRIVAGAPRLRSTWDVYLDGRTLTWIRGSCAEADTTHRFFVRYYPADAANLQGERGRTRGYNDTGFGFTDRGLRHEGKCMASFDLPEYSVTRIVTGQYDADGHTWEGEFAVTAATPTSTATTDAAVPPLP